MTLVLYVDGVPTNEPTHDEFMSARNAVMAARDAYKDARAHWQKVQTAANGRPDPPDDEEEAYLRALGDPERNICSQCGGDVGKADSWPDGREIAEQRENALGIELHGGYGMFHDWMQLGCVVRLWLCHGCAAELWDFLHLPGEHLHPCEGEDGCTYGWTHAYFQERLDEQNKRWEAKKKARHLSDEQLEAAAPIKGVTFEGQSLTVGEADELAKDEYRSIEIRSAQNLEA